MAKKMQAAPGIMAVSPKVDADVGPNDYEARNAADTLKQAEEIRANKALHGRAKKHLKRGITMSQKAMGNPMGSALMVGCEK